MNLNEKAFQMLLNCSDNSERVSDNVFKFTFENLIDVVIVAENTSKGWRVVSVSND